MEAELRGYANAVAHDLSEPIAAMAMLVGLLERAGRAGPTRGRAPAARGQ